MTITLPPDLERSLAAEARRAGKTPEQVAVELLRDRLPEQAVPESRPAEGSLYDKLAPHLGTWDGPAEPLSLETGRQFGEIVEEKYARRERERDRP